MRSWRLIAIVSLILFLQAGRSSALVDFISGESPYKYGSSKSPSLGELNEKIKALADFYIKTEKAENISVYFEDLNSGSKIVVNKDEKFAPASLVKLPLMLSILKNAQYDRSVLSKRLEYTSRNTEYAYSSRRAYRLKEGRAYNVGELIEAMIEDSDNIAMSVLVDKIDDTVVSDAFKVFDIPIPLNRGRINRTTVDMYGNLLRKVYKREYLDNDMTTQAISYLLDTSFHEGIESGIPANIFIAHKYGETGIGDRKLDYSDLRSFKKNKGTIESELRRLGLLNSTMEADFGFQSLIYSMRNVSNQDKDRLIKIMGGELSNRWQLHEAAIVFYPLRPYILVIMTKGTKEQRLENILRGISKEVYTFVSSVK